MIDNSSIQIANHSSKDTLNKLIELINTSEINSSKSLNMSVNDYRSLAVTIQDQINKDEFNKKIVSEIIDSLTIYMDSDNFLIQSNIYLRCSRPNNFNTKQDSESIGFHRESFYGPNMEDSVNIWTPIIGVNQNNTLRFIPESHLIPDEEIKIINEDDKHTEKFSNGHKLGFQYSPKKILSGVDLTESQPMVVPYYSSSIFSGNLIHGSALNKSNSIRFSCDFRVIKKSDYKSESKKFHFASNQPYFVEF